MKDELRPTPILKGKVASRFYRTINNSEISDDQKRFLEKCAKLLKTKK